MIAPSLLEPALGKELSMMYMTLFARTGIAVTTVNVPPHRCYVVRQGVRDDLSVSVVGNPHDITICELAKPEVSVTFATLPHPSDVLRAPEAAWNGSLAGKPYIDAFKSVVEYLAENWETIDPWRLSPFPGRSKNPVERIEIEMEEKPSAVTVNPAWVQKTQQAVDKIARKLAAAIKNPPPQQNRRNNGRPYYY